MAAAGRTPTIETYLGRVTKARILLAVEEARGSRAASRIGNLRKGEMAEAAEPLLAGTGWLPEPLRTPGRAMPAPVEVADAEPDTVGTTTVMEVDEPAGGGSVEPTPVEQDEEADVERFVTRGLDQQLDAQVEVLARATRADGTLDAARAISLPAFEQPGSGWGWRVDGPAGHWA